jgi:hypothetical protein
MVNRVIIAFWKNRKEQQIEVFSSLKNFCAVHPDFNYNTMSNYLSKERIPFENEVLRLERKVVNQPTPAEPKRAMAMVGRSFPLKGHDQEAEDLAYWLTKTPGERLAAVTRLVRSNLPKDARMDKSKGTVAIKPQRQDNP